MRRAATLVAVVGFAAGLFGLVRASAVLRSHGGMGVLALWMIVPVAAGALMIAATQTRSVAFVWTTIGAVCGFVVLGAWSLGPFFGFEAMLLFIAGVVHLPVVEPRWKLLTVPLWLVVGACALAAVFLLRDAIFNATHGCVRTVTYSHCESISYAPVMIWGVWLLVATAMVLAAGYAIASARPERAR